MNKHFQISCPVFWGFNRAVDISNTHTIQDCINLFLNIHEQFLFENNYVDLLNFFKEVRKDYHIHYASFEDILNTNETIYVCRHNRSSEAGSSDNFLR